MDPVYTAINGLGLALLKAMNWDVRVRGAEHIPSRDPAVIAANHVSFLDFVFIEFAARTRKRLVRFMAVQEAFHHWLAGPFLLGMKHIPVDKHGNAALVAAVRALRDGEVVGLHPESRISRSLRPEAGKTGAARMAIQAYAPLIPCAVWGSQRLWTHEHRELPRSIVITVDLGPAVAIAPGADSAEVTGRLMGEIRQLVDRAASTYPQHP